MRAATSLARFWRDQGKRDEAVDLLVPVCGGATEHFFLALAHFRGGGIFLARQSYDRAMKWMKDNEKAINANPVLKEELGRFRREAAAPLEITKG